MDICEKFLEIKKDVTVECSKSPGSAWDIARETSLSIGVPLDRSITGIEYAALLILIQNILENE